MARINVVKEAGYTVVPNFHLRDITISLRAKGLLTQMLSLPEGWDFSIAGLAAINGESRGAIGTTLRELESAGYVTRTRIRESSGRLGGSTYVISTTPMREGAKTEA